MSVKQDRAAPRTAADLERKYNFRESFAKVMGIAEDSKRIAKEAVTAIVKLDKKLGQEEIFNRLTKNGTVEGIYRDESGNIYVNASWINSGILTIKDTEGNVVFSANVETGEVLINADHIMIGGGKTLSQMVEESKSLHVILSNEYQGIPADSSGNITTFPTCATTVQVLYGQSDITGKCTLSATASTGVTGSLSGTIYTVTALAADTGYVDIKATYLTMTATKRFTISKVKDGAQGETGTAGRVYILESSATVIKRGQDNVAIPDVITFSAFYRDGNSASRTAYTGRFVIETSFDGDRWSTSYITTADECKFEFFTALQDGSGNYIEDGNGNVLVAWHDESTIMVRCTLYERGSTVNALDMQTVPVVIDVAALTHLQIFNLLTNNGAWQGLFYENGHLYLNGEYMKFIGANIGGWDIGESAIYKDVVNPTDSSIVHRIKFQPPSYSLDNPGDTQILSCQKSTDGGKTFERSFILFADGSASFGNTFIDADGSARFGNTRISSDGEIKSFNPVTGAYDFGLKRLVTGEPSIYLNGDIEVNGLTIDQIPRVGVKTPKTTTLSVGNYTLTFTSGLLTDVGLG